MKEANIDAPVFKTSEFKETKDRVKYHCRHSKFLEAKDLMEKYIEEITATGV